MVVLLGAGVSRAGDRDGPSLVLRLASLAALAVLFGVTGGLSWLIGLSGFTEIRSWNRISVFIALYALLAVGIALDRFVRWLPAFRWKRQVAALGAILLVVLGVLDQTSDAITPDARKNQQQWGSDAAFVSQIEHTVGPHAAVFQLPYLPYPEAQLDLPPYGMQDYDPFRGYLHSDTLRWSYGAMRGRPGDWARQVVKLPTAQMLDAVTAVGFRGLWLDRAGYSARGADIEAEVAALTGQQPVQSSDGRFWFFDLRDYAQSARARLGDAGVANLRAETLRNVG
jgi:phosphoglycerol transferase